MSKRECGAITPKVVVAVAVMREETHAKPLDLAESAEMLRKLLDSFKNDVVDLVLANAFPEAKAAAKSEPKPATDPSTKISPKLPPQPEAKPQPKVEHVADTHAS